MNPQKTPFKGFLFMGLLLTLVGSGGGTHAAPSSKSALNQLKNFPGELKEKAKDKATALKEKITHTDTYQKLHIKKLAHEEKALADKSAKLPQSAPEKKTVDEKLAKVRTQKTAEENTLWQKKEERHTAKAQKYKGLRGDEDTNAPAGIRKETFQTIESQPLPPRAKTPPKEEPHYANGVNVTQEKKNPRPPSFPAPPRPLDPQIHALSPPNTTSSSDYLKPSDPAFLQGRPTTVKVVKHQKKQQPPKQ